MADPGADFLRRQTTSTNASVKSKVDANLLTLVSVGSANPPSGITLSLRGDYDLSHVPVYLLVCPNLGRRRMTTWNTVTDTQCSISNHSNSGKTDNIYSNNDSRRSLGCRSAHGKNGLPRNYAQFE